MFHKVPINCKDDQELTPLFYASKAGIAINVFELCEKGAEVNHRIRVSSTIDAESPPVTALYFAKNLDVVDILLEFGAKPSNKSMIRFMNENSDLARAVLDNCLSKQKDEENDKDMLFMDFSIFQDDKNDMSVFQKTKERILDKLLLHPMIKMFLHMKFFSMNMWALYYAMILYTLLVFSFVALGYTYVQADHCYNLTESDQNDPCFMTKVAYFKVCPFNETHSQVIEPVPKFFLSKLTCNEHCYIDGNEDAIEKLRGTTLLEQGFFWLSVVLTVLVSIGEVDQLWSLKVKYFSSIENILQFCLIWISVSFYACKFMGDTSNAKIIVSWMVLMSCMNFTVVWARVDRMRPYIHMFGRVIKTMLWCMLAFVPTLMGFSNAFYLTMNYMPTFDNPVGTIVKTLAMAIGELDYSDNFDLDSVTEFGISRSANASSKIMLIIFILGSLMFLNLMVSVAVHDVQSLYKESELIDMQQKIMDILEAYKWGSWRRKKLTNFSAFKINEMNTEVILRLFSISPCIIIDLLAFIFR